MNNAKIEPVSAALELIHQESTLCLATSGDEGPWAAPVYYVFHQRGFFFFSRPDTRHISEGLSHGVGGSLYSAADTWQAIRGIQMAGRIKSAGTGVSALRALAAYLIKYPFTRDFFNQAEPDLADFSRQMKVRFYCFTPDRVIYTDNRIRFGFRTEIRLP